MASSRTSPSGGVERSRGEAGELHRCAHRGPGHPRIGGDRIHRRRPKLGGARAPGGGARFAQGRLVRLRHHRPHIQEMVAEGYLPAKEGLAWRAAPAGEVTPFPQAGEKVYLKAQMVHGVSLPISNLFLSVLNHYRVQPQNLSPNSILALSNYAALCEGYLGIKPRLDIFVYFFTVKREAGSNKEELRNCGTISFKIRPGRRFPDIV